MSEELELRQISNEYYKKTYRYPTLIYLRKTFPYMGIILATLSSFLFSLCSVIVKCLTDVGPIELAVFRFLGVLLPSIPIVIYRKEEVFPEGKRIILMLRCIVGCLGLCLSFYAFRYMNLADASVIIFSMPIFVAIFARIFLKEPCGLFHVITIILTLLGVVLIAKPPILFSDPNKNDDGFTEENYNVYGPISALGSTIFGANAITLLRALKGLHFSVVMTNFGFFSTIYTLLILFYLKDLCWPACGRDRWLILAIAIFSFGGQILLTLALQIENAGPVSIGRSTDIVFAFIWQVLFFKESILNFYSLMGAFLVISCVFLNGFRKWLLALPRDNETRKRFRLFAID